MRFVGRVRDCYKIYLGARGRALRHGEVVEVYICAGDICVETEARVFYQNGRYPFIYSYTNLCRHGFGSCLLYTSPSPRDLSTSRMPSSA